MILFYIIIILWSKSNRSIKSWWNKLQIYVKQVSYFCFLKGPTLKSRARWRDKPISMRPIGSRLVWCDALCSMLLLSHLVNISLASSTRPPICSATTSAIRLTDTEISAQPNKQHCATSFISLKALSNLWSITITSNPRSPTLIWSSARDGIFFCLDDSVERPNMS